MKVLLTSTSFQDTPGKHQKLLEEQAYEIDRLRGPLTEAEIIDVIGKYDAIICGDDELNRKVLTKAVEGNLKYISKYGVGLDKIDLEAAKTLNIPVTNCPGVNQVSVAEHVFALLLSFSRNIHHEYNITKSGGWKRMTGSEIHGKTMGIIGYGAIGKEVAKRALCFGLETVIYDPYAEITTDSKYRKVDTLTELLEIADIISLHVPLNKETHHIIGENEIKNLIKQGAIIINTSRGPLVDKNVLIQSLKNGKIKGYLTDVLDIEPISKEEPLKDVENVLITPHIGSRTNESVERQGTMAVNNLIEMIKNK